MRKKNNMLISKLLNLIGKSCTFTGTKFNGNIQSLELCNLHYIRTYERVLDKKTSSQRIVKNQFLGLFHDDVYFKDNSYFKSLPKNRKVNILGEDKSDKFIQLKSKLIYNMP